ncbi:MAG: tol-pal system protein YbgF [Pseudomonadota bacterium]|nr:tol-pal system protein YbgF [Pseudomonadota bacterium]
MRIARGFGLAVLLATPFAVAEAPTPAAGAGGVGAELLFQLQQLQSEVLTLRGQVEEQAHEIDLLKSRQRDHYLDLDRRLNRLEDAQVPVTQQAPSAPALVTRAEPPTDAAAPDSSADEAAHYQAAYEKVRARDFEAAKQGFLVFLNRFPRGSFSANAYYWLGELYLLESDLEAARDAFTQVITEFPDHNKTADSMYKLGVTYHKMGDAEQARTVLEKTQQIYPDHSAARLAALYLRNLR